MGRSIQQSVAVLPDAQLENSDRKEEIKADFNDYNI